MSGYKNYDGGSSDNRDSDYQDSSHSYTRNNFGKTSDFSTVMISKDGKFLGLDLPPEMRNTAQSVLPALLTMASGWARKQGMKHSPMMGNIAGFGVALSQQIFEVVQNARDQLDYMNKLRIAVKPLEKYDNQNGGPLSSNYKAVENARAKIAARFYTGLAETAVGTIAAAPALMDNIKQMHSENHGLQLQHDVEKAKNDPTKLADIFEKEITVGTAKMGLSGEDFYKAKGLLLEKYRKSYLTEFAAFEKANSVASKKDLKALLDGLRPKNIDSQLRELERHGFNTERLGSAVRPWGGATIEPAVIKDAIKEFKESSGKRQLEDISKRDLRKKFVMQKGVALDEEWQEVFSTRNRWGGYENNQNMPPTIARQLDEKIDKIREMQEKTKQDELSGGGKHDKTVVDGIKGFAAGIGSIFAKKILIGDRVERYAQPMALDRILNLRRSTEPPKDAQSDWKPPEEVPAVVAEGQQGQGRDQPPMGYVQYVHNIFQQHQQDSGWGKIGDRFFDHLTQSGQWKSDSEIMGMADEKLTPYEFALKTIAQRGKTGRMDWIAIVPLLEGAIVHSDGRTFGPRGAGKDDEAVKKAILKVIDDKTVMLPVAKKQTAGQVNENIANFIFEVNDLKKALESKEMDAKQQAFIFTLFSDVVGGDESLCTKVGVTKERCQSLRTQAKDTVNATMDGAISVLADMINNEPEKLEKLSKETGFKLTEKQKELVVALAGKAQDQGKNVADITENHDQVKTLETVAANAAMTLGRQAPVNGEDGKPDGFWQRVASSAQRKIKGVGKRQDKPEKDGKLTDMHEEENVAYRKSQGGSEDKKGDELSEDEGWRGRAQKSKRGGYEDIIESKKSEKSKGSADTEDRADSRADESSRDWGSREKSKRGTDKEKEEFVDHTARDTRDTTEAGRTL
jgi:hypothetical protein